MKTLMSLILIALLTGCGGAITPMNYDAAIKACESNNGVRDVYIWSPLNYTITVRCNNGALFSQIDSRNQ